MIHKYDIETNLGLAQVTFDDEKELVRVQVREGYDISLTYNLIDKLHTQLEDIRFINRMQGKKD